MKAGALPLLAGVVGLALLVASAMAAQEESESLYQPRDPCPQVESIVRDAVNEEFRRNNQITAGFLRVFFHDCFTGGCDASILLDGEWNAGVNRNSVQPRVRQLVNEIRAKVNQQCGDNSVSCADILALATRDSVAAARGPNVPIPRGRFDAKVAGDPGILPGPSDSVDSLLGLFARFGLRNPADLVALSGGHTVGRTRICQIVRPNFQQTCSNNGGRQVLDVITPDEFDNQYFVGLTRNQGVFQSDQSLLDHPRTGAVVRDFATSKHNFFNQWGASFAQLSRTNWVAMGNNGEIRRDCTKPNNARLLLSNIIVESEGFATTA